MSMLNISAAESRHALRLPLRNCLGALLSRSIWWLSPNDKDQRLFVANQNRLRDCADVRHPGHTEHPLHLFTEDSKHALDAAGTEGTDTPRNRAAREHSLLTQAQG